MSLVRYVDTETNNYLPSQLGRCDREAKCGYWAKPERKQQPQLYYFKKQPVKKVNVPPQRAFIPIEVLNDTLNIEEYSQNNFVQYYLQGAKFPLPPERVQQAVGLYFIGTAAGFTTFPFIDQHNRVQAVQAVQFDNSNHRKRNTFLHSIIESDYQKQGKVLPQWLKDYKASELKVGCLFGEHLLKLYPTKPVVLVEAPKTAFTCALYFGLPEEPESKLWLAVYSLSSLTEQRCRALQGRTVLLFPDLSKDGKAFKLWQGKAVELSEALNTKFLVSDYLETIATPEQKEKGLDLADFLLETDWRKPAPQPAPQPAGSAESAESVTAEAQQGAGVALQPDREIVNKIYGFLFQLPTETPCSFIEKLDKEKVPVFIEIVKHFIRNDFGRYWGFYIEFNNNYSAIRKFTYL